MRDESLLSHRMVMCWPIRDDLPEYKDAPVSSFASQELLVSTCHLSHGSHLAWKGPTGMGGPDFRLYKINPQNGGCLQIPAGSGSFNTKTSQVGGSHWYPISDPCSYPIYFDNTFDVFFLMVTVL